MGKRVVYLMTKKFVANRITEKMVQAQYDNFPLLAQIKLRCVFFRFNKL